VILIVFTLSFVLFEVEMYPLVFPVSLRFVEISSISGTIEGIQFGSGEVAISIEGTGVLEINSISVQTGIEGNSVAISKVYSTSLDRAASTYPNSKGYYTWYLPVTLILETGKFYTVEMTATVQGLYGYTTFLTIAPVTIVGTHSLSQ